MKQITLNIADDNYDFFMELMKKLNFVETSAEEDDLNDDVKRLLEERLKNLKRENLYSWEDAKKKFGY